MSSLGPDGSESYCGYHAKKNKNNNDCVKQNQLFLFDNQVLQNLSGVGGLLFSAWLFALFFFLAFAFFQNSLTGTLSKQLLYILL